MPSHPVHHSRRGPRCVLAAVALGLVLGAVPAEAGSSSSFAYAASTGVWVAGPSLLMGVDTPAGRPALLGEFSFAPRRSAFTLTVDEHAALDAQAVLVRVTQFARDRRVHDELRCVPVRVPLRLRVARGVQRVDVEVLSDARYELPALRCSGRAVSGTATVTL